jgi:transposase-like protein
MSPLTGMQTAALARYYSREGKTQAELAKEMGIGQAALSRRIKRARERLQAAGLGLPDPRRQVQRVAQLSSFDYR